ncbi:hypothetical protein ABZU75_43305 [Streptosporangium sp. NPDC005286]|uniref:hypothetical protein n=1 Tax=Streptosporangium sp. NPDC005286 TaxID=3154463 RepID=UPI0033BC0339
MGVPLPIAVRDDDGTGGRADGWDLATQIQLARSARAAQNAAPSKQSLHAS